jgi:hypothetical protein
MERERELAGRDNLLQESKEHIEKLERKQLALKKNQIFYIATHVC